MQRIGEEGEFLTLFLCATPQLFPHPPPTGKDKDSPSLNGLGREKVNQTNGKPSVAAFQ